MNVEYDFLKISSINDFIKRDATMDMQQIDRINKDLEAINNQLVLLEVNESDKQLLVELYNMLVEDIEDALKSE